MFEHWTRRARRIPLAAGLMLLTALTLAACSIGTTRSVTPTMSDDKGQLAANAALGQLGVPYRYGGNSPTGFDCSGLIEYAYASVGVSVPRTTGGLWDGLAPVGNDELRSGDILFFSIDGKMSHVGMYIGNGEFVHSPESGRTVEVESLDSPFYRQAYIRAGRAIPPPH